MEVQALALCPQEASGGHWRLNSDHACYSSYFRLSNSHHRPLSRGLPEQAEVSRRHVPLRIGSLRAGYVQPHRPRSTHLLVRGNPLRGHWHIRRSHHRDNHGLFRWEAGHPGTTVHGRAHGVPRTGAGPGPGGSSGRIPEQHSPRHCHKLHPQDGPPCAVCGPFHQGGGLHPGSQCRRLDTPTHHDAPRVAQQLCPNPGSSHQFSRICHHH